MKKSSAKINVERIKEAKIMMAALMLLLVEILGLVAVSAYFGHEFGELADR